MNDAAATPAGHDMVALPGGTFTMGTDDPNGYPADGEGPARPVTLAPFAIDRFAVTNAQFRAFADATGHVTDSEKYQWSFVFAGLLPDDFAETRGVASAPWWRQVEGASWRHPHGPQSTLDGLDQLPVVHVSWNDASKYCEWAGLELPTEAQWEFAARGGLEGATFPWGDELEPNGQHLMNVWQGDFPHTNDEADGHYGPAPVGSYPANGFGLHDMTGNVWEWCRDWFHPTFHATAPTDNPTGPPAGEQKVKKGGSYICHASYCQRYRVAARSANVADDATGNIGFRCVRTS